MLAEPAAVVLRGHAQQCARALLQPQNAQLVPGRLFLRPAQTAKQLVRRVENAQRLVPSDRAGVSSAGRDSAFV